MESERSFKNKIKIIQGLLHVYYLQSMQDKVKNTQ